ncbi:hypothetical protein DD237_007119 [Peronospora effusa]|uniref:FYVE-type domain-containing protein n=1 Tax=Peronospora effusa TaxID=542832 RepID=A0A3R7XNA0_9STRA|nr:hypothetical protein DD237_007119 [Peronospora effusa]
MMGILSPALESTRSFIDGRSGSAVLSIAKGPTSEEPISLCRCELNGAGCPPSFHKTGKELRPTSTRLGYWLLHSVDFLQAHVLKERVRAKLSVCFFFVKTVSFYMMGMMEPMTEGVRRLIAPDFVNRLLSSLNTHIYGEMKKLRQALGERYAELKMIKSRDPDYNCTACNKNLGRFGKILGRYSTCKWCFRYMCAFEMRFVTDLKIIQRKVTFCFKCVNDTKVYWIISFIICNAER